MLNIVDEDGVEYPVEPYNNIQHNSSIIDPDSAKSQNITQASVWRVQIAQTPVHCNIPEAAVNWVDHTKDDKRDLIVGDFIDAVQAQAHIKYKSTHVLPKIDQVREYILCVAIATEALEATPNGGQCAKKA